jgi:hypothetical protein
MQTNTEGKWESESERLFQCCTDTHSGGTWVVIKKCSLDCCNCAERRSRVLQLEIKNFTRSITAGHAHFAVRSRSALDDGCWRSFWAKNAAFMSPSERASAHRVCSRRSVHTLGIYGMIKVKDYLSTRHPHSTVVYFAHAQTRSGIYTKYSYFPRDVRAVWRRADVWRSKLSCRTCSWAIYNRVSPKNATTL